MGDTKKLIKSSTIVFVGTIIGSFFAYLFNMLMGRQLGPTQYGEMTAILSFIAIVSVIGSTVLTISMRYSSELFNQGYFKALRKLYLFSTKYLIIFGAGLFLISIIASGFIAKFLTIGSSLPVIIASISIIFSLLIMLNKGFLQGLQKFTAVSFVNMLEMTLRLLLGLLLVYLGLKLNGAVSAIVLATAITYFVAFFPLKEIFKTSGKTENFKFDKKEIVSYSWPTLVTSIFLVIALNFDIIIVKHYFDPTTAGIYSAISTIAKIILYISTPIVSVMFPMISEKTVKGDKHFKLFFASLFLTIITTIMILAIYVIAPGKIITLLYGNKYLELYSLLPETGLYILFYALINLLINYYLVIKNFFFLYIFGLILLAQTITVIFWHPSVLSIVRLLIASNGILFVLLLVYYLYTKKDQIMASLKGDYES